VTKPFPTKNLRFFLTAPSPCPYLPGRKERKVFTALDGLDAGALHDVLTNAGFRRSQNIAYRPSCDACDACISARVPVEQFEFTRRWRKIMLRNADLTRSLRPAQATDEQFKLLRRYLASRHSDGGMAEMTFTDFAHIVEYRFTDGPQRGALAAAALVDALGDGLSMVYSFFDPEEARRSLGVYTILDHIQQARAAGFGYLYLGYWIPGSDKMNYKAEFRPLELLLGGEWRPYEPVEF
jgi:arginyl-tRNA--protein-N-Asp/Glu arginylyltransferase